MTKRMIRRSLVTLLGMFAVLLPTVATQSIAGAESSAPTYTVTFENVTSGQYFTPPNFAVHSTQVDVFDLKSPASPGLQAVAENGGVPVLAAELDAAIDAKGWGTSGVGADAPIAPGELVSFDVTSTESKFSLVSMIICTNDGFAGADSKNLPRTNGETITYNLRGYDAGTEINTENVADIVPAPFCGDGSGTGESNPSLAENGVVRVHRTLQGVGDLAPGLDWDNNEAIVQVTITRNADNGEAPTPPAPPAPPTPSNEPTYRVTFTNNTSGQYLTPPNFAAHSTQVDVFDLKSPASPGLQAVAENGGVPVLAAELEAAIDAQGWGVSGVGADAPIIHGSSVEFEFSSTERKFSLVSMIICTNDGFTGADSKNLPRNLGDTVSYDLRGYDAGTEVNTENVADIVPAPFCGDGSGTGESNPALAEDGVVRVHRTLQGNGDLASNFDWDNNESVATVIIERIG